MEHPTELGQPIPTAAISPGGIILPGDGAASADRPDNVLQIDHYAPNTLSPAQVFTGMMFAPFLAWTSITASYLRFFDTGRYLGRT